MIISEAILNQDPHVRSSVIFGRGRFNAGVLIDPSEDHTFDPTDQAKLAAFRTKIWYYSIYLSAAVARADGLIKAHR